MRFGGIFAIAALLLGACSGDPAPKEPAPSPTPSSTATLPAMPDQATEDSPEGAAAFVDHWVDVFNYASQTGDVDELSALSSPDCEGCQSYIDLYRDTYAAGGYFRGGEWGISDIEIEGANEGVRVFARVKAPAGMKHDAQGDEGPTDPMDSDLLFTLRPPDDGEWQLRELERSEG